MQGSYTKRVEGSDLPSDYKESNYSLESSEQRRKTGRAPPGQGGAATATPALGGGRAHSSQWASLAGSFDSSTTRLRLLLLVVLREDR